ncbi:MAG: hypothetical protein FWE59_07015 [Oscillospiraceae bacterium]|nr:hypothetical protein [Oscillospiraceae bacterium]
MKNQGLWVKRAIFLVLFIFVMSYMSYHVVNALTDPVGTVSVFLQTAETVTPLDGWFVRDEAVIGEPGGIWELMAETGQRLAKGDALALTYQDAQTLQAYNEIHELTSRLARLEIISQLDADPVNVGEMDSAIHDALVELLDARDAGLLHGAAGQAVALRALLYKRSIIFEGGQDQNALAQDLETQLQAAQARIGDAQGAVASPDSGIFCAETDGYEAILTPQNLDTLTAKTVLALADRAVAPSASAMGRLARGFSWYYVAVVPQEKLMGAMSVGGSLKLRVDNRITCDVRVYRKETDKSGDCLLILEGDAYMAELITLRNAHCEILWGAQYGLRVPREAVRVNNDGKAGVYCMIFSQQKFKPVEILLERDNYYLVSYKPERTGALLPGDEVIVRGKDLYDGKVLK